MESNITNDILYFLFLFFFKKKKGLTCVVIAPRLKVQLSKPKGTTSPNILYFLMDSNILCGVLYHIFVINFCFS